MPRWSCPILVVALALCVSLGVGCGRAEPKAPVGADGSPLAQDDPNRYIPARVLGYRARKLPPAFQDELNDEIGDYGLTGQVIEVLGATVNQPEDPNPLVFILVAQTSGLGRDALAQVAYFAGGPGRIEGLRAVEVAGQDAWRGKVLTDHDKIEFVVWEPRTGLVVAVASSSYGRHNGADLLDAAGDVVRWSRQ